MQVSLTKGASRCSRTGLCSGLEGKETVVHREDGGEDLDHLALVRDLVVPVKHHTRLPNHEHKVGLCVCLTQAVMRPCAKHEPVLGLLVSITSNPSLRLERIGVWVRLSVMKSHVGSGDDHGSFANSVLGRNGKVLLSEVGDHDDRWPVTERLLDHSARPLQLFNGVKRNRGVNVAVANLDILLTDLVEILWSVSHDLEQPCGG